MNKKRLDYILNSVEKPARYIGLEKNMVKKDADEVDVRFAFAFPDVYEIGMSYLGLQILYFLVNERSYFAMERVFAPWKDMEEQLRKEEMPLFTLESQDDLRNFDILGFTLQYELSYTNILNMMNLANIPLRAADRSEEDPLIIGGGPCSYNPEPIAAFFDLFMIGEGEESVIELLELYRDCKKKGLSKTEFLEEAAKIQGAYCPAHTEVIYHDDQTIDRRVEKTPGSPERVIKRTVRDLNQMYQPDRLLVPNLEVVHDRVVVEIFRGCTQGCRFCQAGMVYRPVREKSVSRILEAADVNLKVTGYDDISLSSLSTCDYPELKELVYRLMEEHQDDKVSVSLPSLRLDSESLDVLSEIQKVRKTGLTFAPEAGTQRLRDVINKGISDEDIHRAVTFAFENGYSSIKLYFMIGLPTETEQDLEGIVEIGNRVVDLFFDREKEKIKGNLRVTLSASCFVPKPFTPLQWMAQDSVDTFRENIRFIQSKIKNRKLTFQYHDPQTSYMEAVVSRGDRRLADVIEKAYHLGACFDGWKDYFKPEIWMQAFEECGVDPDFYARRERSKDEVLPWDFIDAGVSKSFLLREERKAFQEQTTIDCRTQCHACGVNENHPGGYCPCI